jgi:hypothetical protein
MRRLFGLHFAFWVLDWVLFFGGLSYHITHISRVMSWMGDEEFGEVGWDWIDEGWGHDHMKALREAFGTA